MVMKAIRKYGVIYLYVLSGLLLLLSFDVFEMTQYTIWERIGALFIHTTPGIVLLVMTILLRKQALWSGLFWIAYATFFYIFFHFYENVSDNWPMILIMVVPLLFMGCIALLDFFRPKTKK